MSEPENSRRLTTSRRVPPLAREGTFPEQPVRWGIPDVVVGILFSAALITANVVLARIPAIRNSDAAGIGFQILFYALIALFVFAVARRRGLGGLRRDFGFELRWIDLLIGIGLAILIQVANVAVHDFAIGVLRLPDVNTSNADLPKSLPFAVFDGLAVASFLAPVVEELFFLGLVMRAVRNFVIRRSRFESPATTRRAGWISIVVSAAVFAAAHLYESTSLTELFELGVWTLIVGLITAWIATRTGRLGPSMIAHMLTNGLATVLLLSTYQH